MHHYNAMKYRNIGPTRGGRVVAVAGDISDPRVFYFGSTGGGVWKTTDAGVNWDNVSDGYFRYASVGAIAVSESDPNVIYVGMGETTIRGNVSRGDGVYKSTDAGKTWQHCGLAATQNIGAILIHPEDPDLVYVAAFGHVWGPNEERGLYRSTDGGANWERVLFVSDRAGALDLTMDRGNPRVIYVSFWEAHRTPYSLESGGPGSAIFKTSDGGDTWEDLSEKPGLPEKPFGKIGLATAAGGLDRVWAIIEAEKSGLYRSDDGGQSWQLMSDDANIIQRPWYWMHCFADPQDPNTVWLPTFELMRSIDGGKTFQPVSMPHVDNHGLWIDPNNPDRMILGNDGGATVSLNGGLTWSTTYNQPTAEFYHVTTDTRMPYRVYGAQQDNTTMSVPSRSNTPAINFTEWQEVGGGESGYIAVHPENPNIVYAGSYQGLLTRFDSESGLVKNITVWPENWSGWEAGQWKYRFQWTAPTMLSPHDPNTLYTAGNQLFRSTDEGNSWAPVSPDLSRADPETLGPSGGQITKDMTGAETYATIFALAESPVQQGILWAGSDDGLIHVSKDGGENWQNVTPGPDLLPGPEGTPALISIIEASPHDPAHAYVAATRYKSHDDTPYLLKTKDYGESWELITDGIPGDEFTRVIRQDPEEPKLLFAGTERGMYVSFDDGGQWHSFQLNLPVVPIHDFVITNNDLVVATHGRSFWILDDFCPLREIARETVGDGDVVFAPRTTYRFGSVGGFGHAPVKGKNLRFAGGLIVTFEREVLPDGEVVETYTDAGNNPPNGVIVYYYMQNEPEGEVTLSILDAEQNEIKRFSSKAEQDNLKLRPKQGANRFVWDFRYPDASSIEGDEVAKTFVGGPKAPPGTYYVKLETPSGNSMQSFEVLPDPRVGSSQEDFRAQFELGIKIRDKISAIHETVEAIRNIRKQVDSWLGRVESENVQQAGTQLKEQLDDIEGNLIQIKAKGPKDRLKFPVKENAKLASLMNAVASAEGHPNQQSYALFDEIAGRVDQQLERFQSLKAGDLVAFNDKVAATGVEAVRV